MHSPFYHLAEIQGCFAIDIVSCEEAELMMDDDNQTLSRSMQTGY